MLRRATRLTTATLRVARPGGRRRAGRWQRRERQQTLDRAARPTGPWNSGVGTRLGVRRPGGQRTAFGGQGHNRGYHLTGSILRMASNTESPRSSGISREIESENREVLLLLALIFLIQGLAMSASGLVPPEVLGPRWLKPPSLSGAQSFTNSASLECLDATFQGSRPQARRCFASALGGSTQCAAGTGDSGPQPA